MNTRPIGAPDGARSETAGPRPHLVEFTEPVAPQIAQTLGRWWLISVVVGFLGMVLPGIILNDEKAVSLPWDWAQYVDPWMRMHGGLAIPLALLALIAWKSGQAWRIRSLKRAIAAERTHDPHAAPASQQREWAVKDSTAELRTTLKVLGWILVGAGGFLFVFAGLTRAVPVEDGLGLAIGATTVPGLVMVAVERWVRRLAEPEHRTKSWGDDLTEAAAAAKERADHQQVAPIRTTALVRATGWVWSVALALAALTGALGLWGLYTRKPCEHCDLRTLDPAGEAALNRLWVSTAWLFVASALVITAAMLVQALIRWWIQRDLVRRTAGAQPDRQRPPRQLLTMALVEESGWGWLTALFGLWSIWPLQAALAWWVIPERSTGLPRTDHPQVWQVMLLIGVVSTLGCAFCAWMTATRDPRGRNQIRAVWPLDDRAT